MPIRNSMLVYTRRSISLMKDFELFDPRLDSDPAASSVSQLPVLRARLCVYEANKRACGGRRDGGKREAPVEVSWRSIGVSIFSMTTRSARHAMILTCPPPLLQVSTSRLNTRFRRCA